LTNIKTKTKILGSN